MFPVNQVFKRGELYYRLLWLDGELSFWIDLYSKTAWPEQIAVTGIEQLLIQQEITRVDDPCFSLVARSVEEGSTDWQKREYAWSIIKDEIENTALFYPRERGAAVKRMMAVSGATHQTINRFIRRYWQRGMCKNALLPDYVNSGAKGKPRQSEKAKLGRPRTVRSGVGTNITPVIERVFHQVITSKLLIEKNTAISQAYASALNLIGALMPELQPEELPTPEQFRYFYQSRYAKTLVVEKQHSAVKFAKDIRPLKSTSTAETFGPGHRYQIDATIADVYLLSEHDRSRIVGRPVIYIVQDVFSRMVVGLYIGFEGPSWVSAMIALAHIVEDKVAYCQRFGIEISEDDWPTKGLPAVILADKGEINGTKVEKFAEAFGVHIENASARRGDAKGIVERAFKTVQDEFKPYTPGVVEAVMSTKRGGHDYRQDATLNLPEFTRIILACVLYHNTDKGLEGYDRTEDMPTDLPLIPIELWRWGVSNLTGRLRTAPEQLVQINLMPHFEATVSELGVNLFNCFYTCPELIKAGWLHRSGTKRPDKVLVAYDPRTADHIYIRPSSDLSEYWVCDLTDRSRRFRGLSFWDVWLITKEERKTDAKVRMSTAVAKGKLIQQIESIVAEAGEKKTEIKRPGVKKLGQHIRQNKQLEKSVERQVTAFRPERTEASTPAQVVPIRSNANEDCRFPDMTDLIFGEDTGNE
jgi:putative transposase